MPGQLPSLSLKQRGMLQTPKWRRQADKRLCAHCTPSGSVPASPQRVTANGPPGRCNWGDPAYIAGLLRSRGGWYSGQALPDLHFGRAARSLAALSLAVVGFTTDVSTLDRDACNAERLWLRWPRQAPASGNIKWPWTRSFPTEETILNMTSSHGRSRTPNWQTFAFEFAASPRSLEFRKTLPPPRC